MEENNAFMAYETKIQHIENLPSLKYCLPLLNLYEPGNIVAWLSRICWACKSLLGLQKV